MKKRLLVRKSEIRRENKNIYIFSEGTKTESIYFKAKKEEINDKLRRSGVIIKGTGYNTLSLVNLVLEKKIDTTLDEYWVVFDKDDYERKFDDAIIKAQARGLKVAYSNECFEVWFLMHFIPLDSAILRKDYNNKITQNLKKITGDKKIKYVKKLNIYPYIKEKEVDAIRNAVRLLEGYDKGDSFAKQNPSTTVHLLVESLNNLKNE
ncbi:MAG: RloB family protein [Candidatus Pacebacteria bacterium]|nr:RloB family protein [Candidatus Paceibacterota bacterium]MDD4333934.1 RloB family protein [Candidatus Paceibacterota bacterium]